IEATLVERIGDAGKRLHTGRSRNDQVLTALRLYSRAFLLEYMKSLNELVKELFQFAELHEMVPMPGRTHMQIAMPSSLGLWAGAWAEELMDQLSQALGLWELVDQNPLGSAASYGVPLPLDREMTARLMGFSKVQNNVLYVQNSRGKIESVLLDLMDQTGLTLSKMAQDMILYSLPEFGYFSLPDKLCSGSSIMPQKKNPDGLELIRAKSGSISAYSQQVKNILRSLPSGYNRDFQETKEPFLRGCRQILLSMGIIKLTMEELQVNEEQLIKGFTPDIYATDRAIELVRQGKSFRDAYIEVGLSLEELKTRDPYEALKSRRSTGTTGALKLKEMETRRKELEGHIVRRREPVVQALTSLAGQVPQLK
nr:lyase family protein [Spirochaetaceae bacterium]